MWSSYDALRDGSDKRDADGGSNKNHKATDDGKTEKATPAHPMGYIPNVEDESEKRQRYHQ